MMNRSTVPTHERKLAIEGRMVGGDEPALIVAEMSANHAQDLDLARRTVEAAAEAGADAIKLQTYRPDTMTIDCDRDPFRIGEGTIWEGQSLYELYEDAHTPWEWHAELQELARKLDLIFFSTPFDSSAVEFLEELNVPAYKVASFEMVDLPLLRTIARTGKPMIVSTGMARLAEIEDAVQTCRSSGCEELALMKCTSAYPAPPEEANLRTIPHLSDAFDVPVGLSDHTMGTAVPAAARTLGACIVEKHFILSRDIETPDSEFSLEPDEFQTMVDQVRTVEDALGRVSYELTERQEASTVFRRSLFVVEDVSEGEKFTRDNVRSIRPGDGLAPKFLEDVLGRRASRDIDRGTPLDWAFVG